MRSEGASDTRAGSGSLFLGSQYNNAEKGESVETMKTMNLHRLHRFCFIASSFFMVAKPPRGKAPLFGALKNGGDPLCKIPNGREDWDDGVMGGATGRKLDRFWSCGSTLDIDLTQVGVTRNRTEGEV